MLGFSERAAGLRAVLQGQVAGWRQARQELTDDRVGVLIVDMAHDAHQHQRDGLGEVQHAGSGAEDLRWLEQVGLDVVGEPPGVPLSWLRPWLTTNGSWST